MGGNHKFQWPQWGAMTTSTRPNESQTQLQVAPMGGNHQSYSPSWEAITNSGRPQGGDHKFRSPQRGAITDSGRPKGEKSQMQLAPMLGNRKFRLPLWWMITFARCPNGSTGGQPGPVLVCDPP